MKRLLLTAAGIAIGVVAIATADWVYNQNIITDSPIAYSQNYALNLNTTPNQTGISRVSAQAIGSSATLPTSTFNDGRASTGIVNVTANTGLTLSTATDQVTFASTALLLAAPATNQITILSTSGISAMTLTYYNGISSNSVVAGRDWFVTNTTTGTAASLASALALYTSIQVSRASSVIYASATVTGTGGNNFRFSSSSPTVVSTATISFSGGHTAPLQNSYLTFNGQKLIQGQAWSVQDTSSGTATSLATVLNLMPGISASASGSVVYATATTGGSAANSFTMTSTQPSFMTVANATFTGGVDNAYLKVNGVSLVQGTAWTRGSTSSATAKAISDSINASASLSPIVTSVWTTAATSFTITADQVGTLGNYTTVGSPAAIAPGNPTLTGGANASFTVGSPVILIASHGYSTAIPLLLTGSAPPAPLVAGTTYYSIDVDDNDIELALTSTGAVAGTYITLTSSSTTGPHTTTLTPLAITGTASFKWQASNDCVTYQDFTTTAGGVAVSSVTFGTPYTAFVTNWDFGPVNFQCIRAAVVGPTTGAVNLQIRVNGKNL